MELSSQRIYLIGSFHKFRDRIIKALPKYNFSDPRKHRQSCVLKLAYDDMTEAEECPGALAVFPKGKTRGKMSYAEIAVSVVNGNHLIVVDENENLDPLLKKGAKDYFTSLDDAISFLKTDPKLDSGIKGDIIKKYPADAGDSEIPMKNVYICGTIEDRLRDIVDKAGPYHPDRNFIFKSEDTYKDFQNISDYDLIVANFPAHLDWEEHACFMMGAAYPHDIPVLILDNHDWKYPPLQALARRHGTIDVLFEYLTDVDDQNVSKEALDMYDFFGRERERRNKA